MSVARMLTRLAILCTVLLGVVGFGANSALAVNPDCRFSISNFPVSMTAGSSYDVQIRARNHSHTHYTNVRRVFTVQLTGLTATGVTVSGGSALAKTALGPGRIMFTDTAPGEIGSGDHEDAATERWSYRIQFAGSAPSGNATVTFAAYDGNDIINTVDEVTNVRGAAVPKPTPTRQPAPPTTTSAPSAAAVVTSASPSPVASESPAAEGSGEPTELTGSSAALVSADGDAKSEPGMPGWIYAAGAGLAGLGVLATWWLRRPKDDDDDDDDYQPRNGRGPRWGAPAPAPTQSPLRSSPGRIHVIGG